MAKLLVCQNWKPNLPACFGRRFYVLGGPMDFRSRVKLTPEDQLTIRKWKWRVAIVYGAVLLFLVLIVAAGPYTGTNTTTTSSEGSISVATMGPAHVVSARHVTSHH